MSIVSQTERINKDLFHFVDRKDMGNTTQETTQVWLGERLGEKLGETQAAIVKAMAANSKVTVVQLTQSLQISTTVVEKNLKILKSKGYIERIGPAKGGYWKVKGMES